ncbi:MAG TPA: hypothetical protein VN736_13355 [Candidatus Limnocylindrales bacterium]|nr:hypothetical protein [Candidatus Limnocylindrales bacterium]
MTPLNNAFYTFLILVAAEFLRLWVRRRHERIYRLDRALLTAIRLEFGRGGYQDRGVARLCL